MRRMFGVLALSLALVVAIGGIGVAHSPFPQGLKSQDGVYRGCPYVLYWGSSPISPHRADARTGNNNCLDRVGAWLAYHNTSGGTSSLAWKYHSSYVNNYTWDGSSNGAWHWSGHKVSKDGYTKTIYKTS